MYPIIPRQVANEDNVNVNGREAQAQEQAQGQPPRPQFAGVLEAIEEDEEDDYVDMLANKRTRAQKSESEGIVKEEKSRSKERKYMDKGKAPMGEAETSKQTKVRARRRKIGMDDFKLGQGQSTYKLLEELKKKKVDITYG